MVLERCLLLALGVLLLGEDVERDPTVLPPLSKPRPAPQPTPQPMPPPAPPIPAGPRFPFAGPGPRRLDLDPRALEELEAVEPDEETRVAGMLRRYLEDTQARAAVTRGGASPAWWDLARRVETFWHPAYDQVRDPAITEIGGPWLLATARRYLLEAPRTLTETGNTAEVSALVEIRFGAEGETEARLVETSGFKLFDAHALDSARAALENPRGDEAPPANSRSLLEFRARYTILPPAPVLGLAFDECTGYVELMYPLKKLVGGTVYVVAVYAPPAAEAPDGGPADGDPGPRAR
jgi:outer membrane biosynthesis protein TonB